MKTRQYALLILLPPSWDPPACWDTPEGAENVTGGGHTEAVGDDWSDSRQAGNLAPDGSLADLSRYAIDAGDISTCVAEDKGVSR